MKTHRNSLTVLFSVVITATLVIRTQPLRGDEQPDSPLEGVWTVVSMQHDGNKLDANRLESLRFVFTDDKLTIRKAEQVLAETEYDTDATTTPQSIRMTYSGQPTLGIYRRDGDELKICLSGSADAKPTKFVSAADSPNRMLFTLRHTVGWPLFALNVDGTGFRQLVSLPEQLAVGSPDCSPDGKKVAFDAWNRETDENYVGAHVFVVDLASEKLEDIAVGAMPSWSPDGRRMTFCQYSPNRGVYVMNADGSEEKLIDPDGWGSDWSPVGNEIAYTVRDGGQNICIVDPDSVEPRLLFKKQEYQSIYWNLSWSPDGQYICFKGARADGAQEIAVVSTKGDEQGFRVLVSTADGKFKSMWPIVAWDGNQDNILACLRGPDDKRPQLYLLDPDGEKPPMRLPGQDPDRINTDMAWSADGTTAIFISREPGLP